MSGTSEMRTALVTGASAGIGTAFATQLAARGDGVVLVARNGDRLGALAKDLGARHGVPTEVLVADLTDPAQLAAVEARLADRDRPIDVLVNNAGFGTNGRLHELDRDSETREVNLNVVALVRLTHAALGPMVERGHGAVLNVSSLAGAQPTPGNATYGATKAFVTSFTQSVHEELRGTGVKVTVVCPGFTRTEFQANAGIDSSKVPGFLWQSAEEVAAGALGALDKNHAVYVPGALNRLAAGVVSVLPDALTRRAAGFVVERAEQPRP
jgi:short-subunit dehydrogenase